jgi:hypothetical protein
MIIEFSRLKDLDYTALKGRSEESTTCGIMGQIAVANAATYLNRVVSRKKGASIQ